MSAEELVPLLASRGVTLATAESLTGGLLSAAVTSISGASEVFRGGVVAYATDLKTGLLGVDAVLLERVGAVDSQVAQQMAQGAAQQLGADIGLSTTGVAGPTQQDGNPVGTVFIGCFYDGQVIVEEHHFTGDRSRIRESSVNAALNLLKRVL